MADGRHLGGTEGQRGFLGALLLMLALAVGQFVTLERKISFRPAGDQAVTRTAAEKFAKRAAVPRPLSAGGGTSSGDSLLLSSGSIERRALKAKAAGSGGDPSTDLAFLLPSQRDVLTLRPGNQAEKAPAPSVPIAAPRHYFEGRAPPSVLAQA